MSGRDLRFRYPKVEESREYFEGTWLFYKDESEQSVRSKYGAPDYSEYGHETITKLGYTKFTLPGSDGNCELLLWLDQAWIVSNCIFSTKPLDHNNNLVQIYEGMPSIELIRRYGEADEIIGAQWHYKVIAKEGTERSCRILMGEDKKVTAVLNDDDSCEEGYIHKDLL